MSLPNDATLADLALDAVISMDGAGRVTGWNQRAEEMFGWSSEEALGRTVSDLIIPQRYRRAHEQGLSDYLAGGDGPLLGTVAQLNALRRDGNEFPLELAISPAHRSAEPAAFVAFGRDVTDAARIEAVRSMRFAVTRALAAAAGLEAAGPAVLDAIGSAMGWRAGAMWVVDSNAGVLRWKAGWVAPGLAGVGFDIRDHKLSWRRGAGLPGRVWESGAVESDGAGVSLGIPVLHGADVVGVIDFVTTDSLPLDAAILSSLTEAGREVGQFIEHLRADHRAGESTAPPDRGPADFLNLAAHELRGPLAVLVGYLSLAEEGVFGELPPKFRALVPLLDAKLAEMNALIDGMIETAHLDQGRLEFDPVPLDLRDVVEVAVERARAHAPAGQDLEVTAPSTPIPVVGDPGRLETVVGNLVSNAVRYSPRLTPVLCTVSVSDAVAMVTVSDHGIGIRGEDLPVLFTRFGRIREAETSQLSGAGLGLFLSRELARVHGGDILAVSESGVGSTFTLTLPLAASAT